MREPLDKMPAMMGVLPNEFPETADIETSSEDYARRFNGPVGAWFLKVQEEATMRMLSDHNGGSVLDVGGGHGQLTDSLIRNGFRVSVLGSSEDCKARIRSWVDRQLCSFRVGNILEMPFPDQHFDVVISFRLLAHVDRWRPFLRELARVSRNAVILDYPTVRSVNFVSPMLFGWKKRIEGNTRPYQCFRESDLMEVFQSVGFDRAERYPQFAVPMVVHRFLGFPALSCSAERVFRLFGLTDRFGSPVILKTVRAKDK